LHFPHFHECKYTLLKPNVLRPYLRDCVSAGPDRKPDVHHCSNKETTHMALGRASTESSLRCDWRQGILLTCSVHRASTNFLIALGYLRAPLAISMATKAIKSRIQTLAQNPLVRGSPHCPPPPSLLPFFLCSFFSSSL